jgi:flagellar motor switch protein FliN
MNEAPVLQVSSETGNGESNLGLLLDVELNVLLRFGQRLLTLREVLDLKCGSVIELDRRVDEPVELLLDGRVIARGNAAIVDGNYGLQITEVLQPQSPARAADFGQGHWR